MFGLSQLKKSYSTSTIYIIALRTVQMHTTRLQHYKHEWLVVLHSVTVAPCFFQMSCRKTQFPTRISCTHFSFSTYITNTPNRDNLVFCDHPYPSTISKRRSRNEHISFYNLKTQETQSVLQKNRGRLVDCIYL